MSLPQAELGKIGSWLKRDPAGNALVISRVLHADRAPEILYDDIDDLHAVVAFDREKGRMVLTATDSHRLRQLLIGLPSGEYHFSAVDLDLIPVLEELMEVDSEVPAWLFNMKREDFHPTSVVATEPVRVEHAEMIAKNWLDEDAADYVRSRIDKGPTAGIYVNGELVAWDMTHLETDDVVMLGFLHVMEPHRGKGYAKTVATAMLEKVFSSGRMPVCHVFEDNHVSINLSEQMGFRRIKKQVWGKARKA